MIPYTEFFVKESAAVFQWEYWGFHRYFDVVSGGNSPLIPSRSQAVLGESLLVNSPLVPSRTQDMLGESLLGNQ